MTEESHSDLRPLRSAVSGQFVGMSRARLVVVEKNEVPRRPLFRGSIRFADPQSGDDIEIIKAINDFFWGSVEQDVFGRTYSVLDCDNLFAVPLPDEPNASDIECRGVAGNAAITAEEDFLHIVVFHVWPQWHGRGVGRAMLRAIVDAAGNRGFRTIRLGTTNDNLPALYFYQRMGFVLDEIVRDEVARQHGCLARGFAGIPIRDEIRLRLDL